MRPLLTLTIGMLMSVILGTSAYAQSHTSSIKPYPLRGTSKAKTVNISVSYQFFMEGDTGNMDIQAKLADQGRKHLYRMFARECEVLHQTIASECRINRANVSTQVQKYRSNRRRDGIRISGSATYRIELKPTKP